MGIIYYGQMLWESFDILFALAQKEDLGANGDATSSAIFSNEIITAELWSKEDGILAGSEFFKQVFTRRDISVKINFMKQDGSELCNGDLIASVNGNVHSILSSERIALNFLSYLSGIATVSNRFAAEAAEYGETVILDTRKTLPGYRALAKYAVKVGGSSNHRMGLYDMVMIKDNHADAAGSISNAVNKVRSKWENSLPIEVECRTLDEVKEALENNVDFIMLDNMQPSMITEAVALKSGKVKFEISGNMNFEKLKTFVPLGADFISVGQLTHSVQSFDFSLRIKD